MDDDDGLLIPLEKTEEIILINKIKEVKILLKF